MRDRRRETGTFIKIVMGQNFFKTMAQWWNFLMVQIFSPKCGTKIKWHSGAGNVMAQNVLLK